MSTVTNLFLFCRTKEKNQIDSSKQDRVQLQVCLDHQVKFGEHVGIIGSTKELGSWKNQVEMEWTPNGWVCQLEIPGEQLLEFKFFIFFKGGKEKIWEDGGNRIVDLPKVGTFDIVCRWNKTNEPLDLSGPPKVMLVGEPAKEIGEDATMSGNIASEVIEDVSVAAVGYPASESESSKFGELWQGSETVFMRSNEHRNKDTNGKWDTTRLDALSLKLVEGDKVPRNWWRKVSWIDSPYLSSLIDTNSMWSFNIAIFILSCFRT
jgi:phosphoglucan, water dikinase